MSKVKRFAVGVIVGLIALSCAVDSTDYSEEFSTDSYLAWIKQNAPNADSLAGNVYIEFFERADNWEELTDTVELDSVFVRINYTGWTLAGDAFETRSESLAKMMGTWLETTHFVDDYVLFSVYSKLSVGLLLGLDSMRVGDSARIYMPYELGYTSSMNVNSGYAGTTSYYTGYPVYFDIRLSAIVDDPDTYELNELNSWVLENWGTSGYDTLAEGFYFRLLTENPVGDTITEDSSATYDYCSYFLDGQGIITTIEDTAYVWGYHDDDESYSDITITSSTFTDIDDTTNTYRVFPMSILNMRAGEVGEAVCISDYAAGNSGDQTNVPEIQYYQPQRFIIFVEDDTDYDDEEEEEE
ncbi:MAG: hypothetical protein R3Y61_05630 [Rikenellaceae bacterium]